jgi:hypothetical protein
MIDHKNFHAEPEYAVNETICLTLLIGPMCSFLRWHNLGFRVNRKP